MAWFSNSEDAWTRARRRYIEDLTESEQEIFNNASLENVFYSASAMQKVHHAQSIPRVIGTRLQPFIAAIEQYGKALDVYANGSSIVLGPLWGSLRVVLHLASEFHKYFEKLVEMFVSIGDVLPRLRVFENLFPGHEHLVQALSEVYMDILRFCTDAKAVFRKGKRSSVLSLKVAFKLVWKPFDQQFGKVMCDFREHRKNVEKEAGLSHMIEAKKARDLEIFNQAQLEERRKENDRDQLLSLLSSVDYKLKHRKTKGLRHQRTGAWLTETAEFQTWKGSRGSACLCCYGMPGSGKTILASKIIDTLSNEVHGQETVAYYYCDYSDQKTLGTSSILGTIIRQLLLKQPIDSVESCLREFYKSDTRVLDKDELVGILCAIPSLHNHGVFMVIDGLDECEQEVQKEVLSALTDLMASDRVVVKIYISSRIDTQISTTLRDYPQINLHESQVTGDITIFVEETVKSRMETGDLVLRDPVLEQEIVSELIAKAHGMFLWVFLQLEDICDATQSDTAIRETLRHLPEGLMATYQRILMKIAKSSPRKINVVQRIIKWVLCARRSLSIGELKEAIAVDPGDESWDMGKISTNPDGQRLIQACGNLVVLDMEDGTVRFIHHTVQQYLLSKPRIGSSPDFHFELSQVNFYAAEVCMTYLSFSDFEKQITVSQPNFILQPTGILAPAGVGNIANLLGIGTRVFNILHRLWGGDTKQTLPVIDYAELVSKAKKTLPTPWLNHKYCFLSYIVQHWTWHARALSFTESQRPDTWSMFKNLVLNKTNVTEFRDWGPNLGPPSLPYMTIFLWAVKEGHAPLLSLLRRVSIGSSLSAYYHNVRIHSPEPIFTAFHHGHIQVIRLLTDDTKSLLSDLELFSKAAQNGHEVVIQYMLEQIPLDDLPDLRAKDGGIALEIAMKNGHETMVQLLHKWQFQGHVPTTEILFWAAKHGHTNTLQYLVRQIPGLDLNARNERGDRPLYLAASNGHASTVQLLLENIKDLELRTLELNTVLDLATSNGNETVVRTLLHEGVDITPALEKEVVSGNLGVIQLLLKCGVNTETVDVHKRTLLHQAAWAGHEAIVRLLVEKGANIKAVDVHERTPLYYAASRGDEAIVRLLIEKGANMEAVDVHERTPLHYAASGGQEAIVRLLMEKGANIEAESISNSTPLHYAARGNHEAIVQLLVEKEANMEAVDVSNSTPLHYAAKGNHEAILQLLMEKGANMEAVDDFERTPLLEAVWGGHEAIVRLLVEKGANIEVENGFKSTPLHHAARGNHEAIVRLLVEKGANMEAIEVHQKTPLHYAARSGHEAIVRLLIEKGANIEAVDIQERTPLHKAASRGDEAIVRLLVEKGANMEAIEIHQKTPLHYAARSGHEAIVRLLIEKGANIEAVDIQERTPLHKAASRGDEAIVRLLVEKGANIEAVDVHKSTPLHEAASGGHQAVVWLLVEIGAKMLMLDDHGRTARKVAIEAGKTDIAKLLLEAESSLKPPVPIWSPRQGRWIVQI